jgi:hypothetical protein
MLNIHYYLSSACASDVYFTVGLPTVGWYINAKYSLHSHLSSAQVLAVYSIVG